MHLFNKPEIERFIVKHAVTRNALRQWVNLVEEADWKNHNDLKQTFPSADYVGNARYVFNIKGNGYRIVAVVVFIAGTLTIRFVGTHEEYDKIDCKTI
jgi:mRNA interferase HigB